MSIDAGHPGISWTLQFRARIDGALIALHSTDDTGWKLFIRSSALFLEGSTQAMTFALDMEDTASVTDGTWHSLALTATAAGSKIFLDGYQCFSTTADLSPAASGPDAQLSLTPGAGIEIRSFAEHESVLSGKRSLPSPPPPHPSSSSPPPTCRITTSPSCPNSPLAPSSPAIACAAPGSTERSLQPAEQAPSS